MFLRDNIHYTLKISNFIKRINPSEVKIDIPIRHFPVRIFNRSIYLKN
jgi:hypothetical protein